MRSTDCVKTCQSKNFILDNFVSDFVLQEYEVFCELHFMQKQQAEW